MTVIPDVVVGREPIVPHYICADCGRRHSTRTEIGRDHLDRARKPKRS